MSALNAVWRRNISETAAGALPILLVLGIWYVMAAWNFAPASLLPSPVTVFRRFFEQLGDRQFLQNAGATLYRLFAGFGIAVVLGVSLGILAAGNRVFAALLQPIIRVLAP